MAYGNNIKGEQPRAHFQEAGGAIIKFRHPYLNGQVSDVSPNIDWIDVSKALKLADTYLQATPNQDSAVQEVMIDGSTVTITNRLMNGTLSLPIVPTNGLVSGGDFVAALHLIQSVGDKVGGILTLTEHIDGLAVTTIYYGVTPKNVPHKIKMGMGVPTYNCTLVYSGWVQAVSKSGELNTQAIWATGNKTGVKAAYAPYGINNGGTGDGSVQVGTDGIIETSQADQTGIQGEGESEAFGFNTSGIDEDNTVVSNYIPITNPSADGNTNKENPEGNLNSNPAGGAGGEGAGGAGAGGEGA